MTKKQKKDMARADVLMTDLFNVKENERKLTSTIANELKAYKEGAASLEKELLEIAKRNPEAFDDDGNWKLIDGYVHISTATKVKIAKKFELAKFLRLKPTLVNWSFKIAQLKKMWLNNAKELKSLGVKLTTEEELQVIPNKVI